MKNRDFALRAKLSSFVARLRGDTSGLALVEFAFSLPILLSFGMIGTEAAMYVQTHTKISQIALIVADNASRIGESSSLQVKRVDEADINDILDGAEKQMGRNDFYTFGRVVISGVQYNALNSPYIAWQRCRGALNYTSLVGPEGTAKTTTALSAGVGRPNEKVSPIPGTAMMYVEVAYPYQSLFGIAPFAHNIITQTAALNVRDTRDLQQVYNASATTKSSC
jgi:Flp pilus assembly protein TadG